MQLSQNFFSFIPKSVKIENTKFFYIFSNCLGKKVYFSGKRVQLLDYKKEYDVNFKEITEEEAKKKHLGKVRCLGSIHDERHLLIVLSRYFQFAEPESNQISCLIKTKIEKHKDVCKKIATRKILQLTEVPISDRDEPKLISAFRQSTNEREKNKIFNTILFDRGVNGKSWHQIITNYVSYNSYKFVNIADHDEKDFYQEVVFALSKTVEKWFDNSKNCCFSTYAWFVINCAFHRVLQALSTQKRKVAYQASNIDLNDKDSVWDESISIEKTHFKQPSFEEEFVYKNLFSHIQKMFELKPINASEELTKDLLKVIQNKSTIETSIYTLAKKHNVEINEMIKIELALRENLKNSMYADIISYMKDDINGDEEIAKKYKRSKGHVIKMKRQLGIFVKAKMKEMDI